MKIHLALFATLTSCMALANETNSVNLLPSKDKELQLPYAQSQKIEFVCSWDAGKRPTVLEFTARIDTPAKEASTGGPVPLLKIELNGQLLGETTESGKPRLLNKPLKSSRDLKTAEVVWFEPPHWALMYCGSSNPPANDYTPHEGSPVRFVLDVTDYVNSKTKNEFVFTYHKTMVGEQTLAESCRATGTGEATVVFGEMAVRPRKDSDGFQPKSKP